MKLALLFGRRLLLSALLALIIPAIIFVLIGLSPGSIGERLLGDAPPAAVHALEVQLGLDQPIIVQYAHWFADVFQGNFGTSYVTAQPVTTVLGSRSVVTTTIIVGALLLSTIIGIPFGVASARSRRAPLAVINVLSVIGMALPNFVIALALMQIFAVMFRLVPATGYVAFDTSPGNWLLSIILPVVALSVHLVTSVVKQTRDQMMSVSQGDFVKSLRARGIGRASIIGKHELRNAMIPVVTVIGVNMVAAVGGSIYIEQVFALPGVGRSLIQAVGLGDIPVLLGCAFYFTVVTIVVNILVDLAYVVLDPRMRANGVA